MSDMLFFLGVVMTTRAALHSLLADLLPEVMLIGGLAFVSIGDWLARRRLEEK